jgi:hypothetical protein
MVDFNKLSQTHTPLIDSKGKIILSIHREVEYWSKSCKQITMEEVTDKIGQAVWSMEVRDYGNVYLTKIQCTY